MLIPCEECKKNISSEAKQCPNCGHPVKEEWVKAQASPPKQTPDSPGTSPSPGWIKAQESTPKLGQGCGCLLLIIFAAMVLFAGFAIFGGDDAGDSASAPASAPQNSAPQKQDTCDSHVAEAYTLAQFAVKRTLSVPNSVDFPWAGVADTVVVADNDTLCSYKVFSTLEAQNLYGATLERRWTARVKYLKADGTFTVDFAKVLE